METMEVLCEVCSSSSAEYVLCLDCGSPVLHAFIFIGYIFGIIMSCTIFPWLFDKLHAFREWCHALIAGSRAKSEYYQMKLAQEKAAHPANEEAP